MGFPSAIGADIVGFGGGPAAGHAFFPQRTMAVPPPPPPPPLPRSPAPDGGGGYLPPPSGDAPTPSVLTISTSLRRPAVAGGAATLETRMFGLLSSPVGMETRRSVFGSFGGLARQHTASASDVHLAMKEMAGVFGLGYVATRDAAAAEPDTGMSDGERGCGDGGSSGAMVGSGSGAQVPPSFKEQMLISMIQCMTEVSHSELQLLMRRFTSRLHVRVDRRMVPSTQLLVQGASRGSDRSGGAGNGHSSSPPVGYEATACPWAPATGYMVHGGGAEGRRPLGWRPTPPGALGSTASGSTASLRYSSSDAPRAGGAWSPPSRRRPRWQPPTAMPIDALLPRAGGGPAAAVGDNGFACGEAGGSSSFGGAGPSAGDGGSRSGGPSAGDGGSRSGGASAGDGGCRSGGASAGDGGFRSGGASVGDADAYGSAGGGDGGGGDGDGGDGGGGGADGGGGGAAGDGGGRPTKRTRRRINIADVTSAKQRERIQRNRESAARSNQRRREWAATLVTRADAGPGGRMGGGATEGAA
ncbi:hypothetical protein BU14_2250s0001 [Porphyra umbilicalis]|uniref:BZIP domain-containing protein n=1 Tax=Porphyra umbilicalis TaxID=2786 RepID=A0A1X6NJJ8_PORUM|nr:hypothetical protein BU14_2250s0001 [Porphyra umbilicalis]|eukprot:OSX68784.1 hypothetical protein BU14_2250s0001 [Porphyra umbilicalis]